MLAQKLAQQCYFGEDVGKRCFAMEYKKNTTCAGPVWEVSELKQSLLVCFLNAGMFLKIRGHMYEVHDFSKSSLQMFTVDNQQRQLTS